MSSDHGGSILTTAQAASEATAAAGNEAAAGKPGKPWDRLPDENDLWYERFTHYLKLGPRRSVSLAATGRRNAYPLPSHWMVVAKEKRWRERAAAYDRAHGLIADPASPAT